MAAKDPLQNQPKESVKIIFKDRSFVLVKERRNKTRVYRADDETCYLRIGPAQEIQQELGFHKRLLERAYPVPELLEVSEGDLGEEYYLESSVGTEKFGLIFGRECTANGSIDSASFSQFLKIVERFLKAQRNDVCDNQNWETVFIGTHFDFLLEEMPDEQTTIMQVWKKIMNDLREVPFVLCHGDFNAFNVLPGGVIDFETPFDGPLGYDLVSAVTSNSWFPRKGDYEMFAAYFSTDQQIQKMWELAPETVKNFDALFMLRSTWAVVRMQKFPKLQAWRYTLFRQAIDRYLKGDSLYEWWSAMPQE